MKQLLFDARGVKIPALYVHDRGVNISAASTYALSLKPGDRVRIVGTFDGIEIVPTGEMDEAGFFVRKASGTDTTLRICSTGLVQRLIKHFGAEPPFVLEWEGEEYKLKTTR